MLNRKGYRWLPILTVLIKRGKCKALVLPYLRIECPHFSNASYPLVAKFWLTDVSLSLNSGAAHGSTTSLVWVDTNTGTDGGANARGSDTGGSVSVKALGIL